jgi:hypothetical protein
MHLSILLALGLSTALFAQDAVNPHAALIQEFEKRTGEYLKLHKQAEGKMPRLKPTESQAAIAHHERELAERIRKARPEAKTGNIFTSEISAEFRHLIGLAMQGAEAVHIRASLARAEPVRVRLRVNQTYPANVPLQSTPPSLLLNLPALPPDLDYRVVGRDLVLRDAKANMVVDFIPNAIS